MIIKSKRSYSSQRFRQLIEYIFSDKGRANDANSFTIYHNLKSDSKNDVIREFVENDTFRKKRTRGVVLYHEVVTFHPDDKDELSLEILEKIAHKFIELRGKHALCVAKPHMENKNIHIHFCFSGTEYKSSKTLRLDNHDFREIRMSLEKYQEQFPGLNSSLVYLNKWQKDRLLEKENIKNVEKETQLKKRTGKQSNKDAIRGLVRDCYIQSSGKEDFFRQLVDHGLQLYKYRNKINGLMDVDGRKYRFSTLSLSDKELALLERNSDRMMELQKLQKNRSKDRFNELER